MEIKLSFNTEEFKRIYFNNNNDSWIFNETTKTISITFIILLLITIVSGFFHPYSKIELVIILIAFLLITYEFAIKFRRYYNWRMQVNKFLIDNSKFQNCKLEITNNQFILHQDNEVSIEKIDNLVIREINNEYIILIGSTTYMFPKSSMTDEDYALLTESLKEKLKTVL